jgi:hypothetical protein
MFAISYILKGTGWADAVISDRDGCVNMTVSYLHDSLGELTEATSELLEGGTSASVTFMDEPGEHQLHLSQEGGVVAYEVRWYSDWASWDLHPQDEFEVRLRGTCPLKHFTTAVLALLRELLAQHGPAGYKSKWVEHEFPHQGFERLAQLACAEPGAAADPGHGRRWL